MRSLVINKNISELKESATLRINQAVIKKRKENQEIVHFGFGQSPFPVCEPLVNELQKNSFQKDYLPTLGLLELRERIKQYHKRKFNYDFTPETIAIGPGSKELIFQTIYLLNGVVFIPAPSWVSYGPQVEARGGKIHTIDCELESDYKLTAASLDKACKEYPDEQKILIINSPNNPTGCVYNTQEVEDIVKIAKKYNLIIVSDEIYGEVDWSHDSAMKNKSNFFNLYPERTLVSSGLSKLHGAGGWRLGFLAGSEYMQEFFNSLSSLISETFSAVSAPIQYAAILAYSDNIEIGEYIKNTNTIHRGVATYMYNRFIKLGLKVPRPNGAFYLMPDFSSKREFLSEKYHIRTSLDLSETLLNEFQIAILPGTDFYQNESLLTCRVATVDYDGKAVLDFVEKEKITEFSKEIVEVKCPNIKLGLDIITKFLEV